MAGVAQLRREGVVLLPGLARLPGRTRHRVAGQPVLRPHRRVRVQRRVQHRHLRTDAAQLPLAQAQVRCGKPQARRPGRGIARAPH